MDFDIALMEERVREKWNQKKPEDNHATEKKSIFSIDTPPPTVSGEIHTGHAYSYPHQDMIARFYRLRGYNVIYPFGFDNNGLATERYVEKVKHVSLSNMEKRSAIELCETTSKDAIEAMKKSFTKLGLSADIDGSYVTYSRDVWKISQSFFIDLFKKNIAYRSEGMTISCPTCRTAISQIEMEDREMETDFITLRFSAENGKYIDIATTRPEMLGACVAIAINPDDERAGDLEKLEFKVPLYDHTVKIIKDQRVLMDKGTGAEMVCTFGDQTDYEIWKDHKLKLVRLLDERGFIRDSSFLEGLKSEEGRKKIKSLLKEGGFVIDTKRIKHSVNTHERCSTPIEIGVSKQWYLRYMDKKEKLLEAGRNIKWNPDYMRIRYENWVKDLKWDWCISRQRIMGIPIPVWYCSDCGKETVPEKDKLPLDPRFESIEKCSHCGSSKLSGETDVLDTWFTSSTTPTIVGSQYGMGNEIVPMTVRFQGHDIISTWAFTTIFRYMVHFGSIPWQRIVISGNVYDSKGQKMSKSKGNAIDPMEMVTNYGADGVRLWGTSLSTWDDISLKEQDLVRGRRTIIKIYNAMSLVASLEDSEETSIELPFNRWILESLNLTISKVTENFENFDLARARFDTDQLFWNDFCDNYLEIIKPFVSRGTDSEKAEIGYVARKVATAILKLYFPIAPFITEDSYGLLHTNKILRDQTWPEVGDRFSTDYEKFSSVIQLISLLRGVKSRAKSSKTEYSGFSVTASEYLDEVEKTIIKGAIREENVDFMKGEKNDAVIKF